MLRSIRYGEADRILHLYSADRGRVNAIAKGSRRPKSRFGGRLDGMLMNAGGPPPGDALALTDEQWRGAYELLVGGPIRVVRELEPLFSEGASVVWIGSSSWRQPIPGLDASNVFRPGLAALVKVLARELAPRVRFVGMAPGRIDTDRVR